MFKLVKSIYYFLVSRLFNQKKPLVISIALTNSCNLRCKYCNIYNLNSPDLPTKKLLNIINELAKENCLMINFTGGEPFLYKNLWQVLKHCKKLNIKTVVTSNGLLIPKYAHYLKYIDKLFLSLDGPKSINNKIRGAQSYEAIIDSLAVAKKYHLKPVIKTTLSQINYKYIKDILIFARRNNLSIQFEFISKIPLTKNKIDRLCISKQQKQNIINKIGFYKKQHYPILNSLSALKFILKNHHIKCAFGNIAFRISNNGYLYNCWRQKNNSYIDLNKYTVRQALKLLPPCQEKYCDLCDSSVELSLVYNFKLDSIFNLFKYK